MKKSKPNQEMIQAKEFMRQKVVKPFLLAVVIGVVFSLVYRILIAKVRFFTGDQAMLGIMTQDMAEGIFYSWYFYGQDYYGSLLPFILSFPARFHPVTVNFLLFFELFFYAISVWFGLSSVKKFSLWLYLPATALLFTFGRFNQFAYSLHGFTLALMIILGFFWLYKRVARDEIKLDWRVFAPTGLITTLSLWHNPIYLFMFLVLSILVGQKQFLQKTFQLNWRHLISFGGGALIGAIPLILATISTNGKNLSYFFGNTSKTYWMNFRYLAYDYINIFSIFPTEDNSDLSLIWTRLLNFEIRLIQPFILNFLIIIAVTALIVFGVKFIKKDNGLLVNYLFLGFLFILLISKWVPSFTPVFVNLRYSFQFYFLVLITLIEILNLAWLKISPNESSKIFEKLCSHLAVPVLTVMLINGISTYWIEWLERGYVMQFNEQIYMDLKSLGAKRVACYNYFEVCSSVAFWGRKDGIKVYGIYEPNRHPAGKYIFEDKTDTSPIYSIVPRELLTKNMEIVKSYRQLPHTTEYLLLRGNFLE